MSFKDVIKKSVLEGFSYSDFSTVKIVVTLGITFLMAAYIFFVYKAVTKRTFYDRNFNISMSIISMVTAGIIMAMQSNLVISLGMVGALSIVRFRTAIKEPMDLLFLFWSISMGIICGAGLYKMAVLLSLAVTAGMLLLQALPVSASPYILVVKYAGQDTEAAILALIKGNLGGKYRLSSKSIRQGESTMILELRVKEPYGLIDEIAKLSGVHSATFMRHDGEVKS